MHSQNLGQHKRRDSAYSLTIALAVQDIPDANFLGEIFTRIIPTDYQIQPAPSNYIKFVQIGVCTRITRYVFEYPWFNRVYRRWFWQSG